MGDLVNRQDVARTTLACIEKIERSEIFDIDNRHEKFRDLSEVSRGIIRDGVTDEMLRFLCKHLADLMIRAGRQ